MLTITFDPQDPLDALESCAAFAELLGDYIGQRRSDFDIPERASAAVSALCEAIAQAQDRAVSALHAARKAAEAAPAAPLPAPAASRAAIAGEIGVSEADLDAIFTVALANIRAAREPTKPAAKPEGRQAFAVRAFAEAEKQAIFAAITECNGCVEGAARKLNISPRTVWRKLRAYRAVGDSIPRLVTRGRRRRAEQPNEVAA